MVILLEKLSYAMVFYCKSTFMYEIFAATGRSYLLLFLSAPANKTATNESGLIKATIILSGKVSIIKLHKVMVYVYLYI
jgi:hypothetical protein